MEKKEKNLMSNLIPIFSLNIREGFTCLLRKFQSHRCPTNPWESSCLDMTAIKNIKHFNITEKKNHLQVAYWKEEQYLRSFKWDKERYCYFTMGKWNTLNCSIIVTVLKCGKFETRHFKHIIYVRLMALSHNNLQTAQVAKKMVAWWQRVKDKRKNKDT